MAEDAECGGAIVGARLPGGRFRLVSRKGSPIDTPDGAVTIELRRPAGTARSSGTGPAGTRAEVSPVASTSAPTHPDEPTAGRAAHAPGASGPSPTGQTPSRRRLRRRWLAFAVAIVAVVAIVAFELPQWLSAAPTTTVWQKITSGITDAGVPKQTALEAFAYVYKVDIPDVVVPSGVNGDDTPTSGTGAMRWVQADWSQLSAAQQAVIDRYLPPETTRGTTQMTPAPSAAGLVPGLARFGPGLAPANGALAVGRALAYRPNVGAQQPRLTVNAPIGWPFTTNVPQDASPDLALAMADDMSGIIVHLGNRLGVPVIYPGPVETPDIVLTLSDADGGNALLDTHPAAWGNGHYSPCYVTAYKNAWGNTAWTAGDKVGSVMHVLLTHEVVHCYQNAVIGDIYNAAAMPSWIIEGTADYLAVDDTGTVGPGDAGAWHDYMIAEISLTTRTYDAMGYFALLAHKGRDLWGTMATAWKAAGHSLQRSNAFIGVLHGDDSDIRDAWAETYVNNSAWQDPWVVPGLGAPVDTSAPQHSTQALAAPGWNGSLLSRSNTLLSLDSTSGEVVTIATDNGLASVHDFAGHTAVDFQEQSFCTVESCVCPPGTALAGQDVAPTHLSIPAIVAVNAPDGGAKWVVIGTKLEDICQHRPTPAPTIQPQPKGPCGTNCSNSNGDPHLLTVNKYRYDFQAAGEFTLLSSADGAVDIQARQEPYGQGFVSINTAVAAKVGSHKVGVYMTGSGLQAHLDGSPVDLSGGPKDLGSGGAMTAIQKGFEIDFPDGTKMWTLSSGQYGIHVLISPSAGIKASGVGLLGPVIPGGLGVPALPDGTRLPAATDNAVRFSVLYGQFADAWRITDATSLFDYDSGKSTASYTIKPYPATPKYLGTTDLSPDQTAAGTSACATITDVDLHDECVFDVGVTGQTGFADGYTATQGLYDNGVVAASPTPAPSFTTPSPAPGTVSGAVTVTQGTQIGGYALGPDDTAYLTVQTADSKFSLIAFDTKAGKIATQVDVPALTPVHFAAGSVWLPGVKTDTNGHNCSITRYDAATLTEQATVATPCSAFGSVGLVASDGDAVWFEDDSKYDLTTQTGAVMTRIDPSTNAPGTSVAVPFLGGYAFDSQGAFFFYGTGTGQGYYRLATGATSLDSMGTLRHARPGGPGLWVSPDSGKTAQYFTSAGSPAATVQTGGAPVAGDAKAVYVDVFGNGDQGSEEQLWRYPIDGSTPTKVNVGPTIDDQQLGYSADPLPIANGDGVLKLWSIHSGSNQTPTILLQWTAVP
jgi:hypothetical protein